MMADEIKMDGCISQDQALAQAKHQAAKDLGFHSGGFVKGPMISDGEIAARLSDPVEYGAPDLTPANIHDEAEKARLSRARRDPVHYGQRIHPDHPLVLDQARIHELGRSLRLMHSQATDAAAYALECMIDDFEMMGLIHQLRSDEGDSISILCDNPEGPPNHAIIGNGGWTGYEDRRIEGETLIDCLRQAIAEKELFNGI